MNYKKIAVVTVLMLCSTNYLGATDIATPQNGFSDLEQLDEDLTNVAIIIARANIETAQMAAERDMATAREMVRDAELAAEAKIIAAKIAAKHTVKNAELAAAKKVSDAEKFGVKTVERLIPIAKAAVCLFAVVQLHSILKRFS
jgi:hypothetical protein